MAFPKFSIVFLRPVLPVVLLLPLPIFGAAAILGMPRHSFLAGFRRLCWIVSSLVISRFFGFEHCSVFGSVLTVIFRLLGSLLLTALAFSAGLPRTSAAAIDRVAVFPCAINGTSFLVGRASADRTGDCCFCHDKASSMLRSPRVIQPSALRGNCSARFAKHR